MCESVNRETVVVMTANLTWSRSLPGQAARPGSPKVRVARLTGDELTPICCGALVDRQLVLLPGGMSARLNPLAGVVVTPDGRLSRDEAVPVTELLSSAAGDALGLGLQRSMGGPLLAPPAGDADVPAWLGRCLDILHGDTAFPAELTQGLSDRPEVARRSNLLACLLFKKCR